MRPPGCKSPSNRSRRRVARASRLHPRERRERAPARRRPRIGRMLALALSLLTASAAPDYTIEAIRYGTIRDFPVSELVVGTPESEKVDIAMVVWLIRGGG